jgi:hypothetical protein
MMAIGMFGSVYQSVCGAAMGMHKQQVELLEGAKALMVDLETGGTTVVARASLPKGVREGDVVVDGHVDPVERALLLMKVAELHKGFQPVGHLEL